NTLFAIQKQAAERKGEICDTVKIEKIREEVKKTYEDQMDIRYGAARGWVDAIIPPHMTRHYLIQFLQILQDVPPKQQVFHTGVFQV
ncbi:MAG: acyl-CoA carboxylase subunit beta, partial [Pseudanabaena sp. M57BS1SP1A06MG]|nr:acyl-CoA carboxylase subunit beta [Pseudanabaena sp. M57BS1SP1A06MG]